MVFCCIAIVAIAIFYFIGLWIRQIFSWPRPDKQASHLPAPPRAMSGNGALPVYGHTRLFSRHAGDVAHLFPPDWTEMKFFNFQWGRKLGDCFSIFFWGQWRVVVKGPERAKLVMESTKLKEGWPWSPPVTLLGKSCLCFLEDEEEADQLKQVLCRPLHYHFLVTEYAPIFAKYAEKCLVETRAGTFKKNKLHNDDPSNDHHDDDTFASGPTREQLLKVKWEALRSYTFDLVDGPILGTYHWTNESLVQSGGEDTQESSPGNDINEDDTDAKTDLPARNQMMMWMERVKAGVDTIKTTFGPEWMYIWILNEYGRALNARMHIESIFHSHVEKMTAHVPVKHEPGHMYLEPSTQAIPLLVVRDNFLRSQEDIFGGDRGKRPSMNTSGQSGLTGNRQRALSHPAFMCPDQDDPDSACCTPYVTPFETEQDLARPQYEKNPFMKERKELIESQLPDKSPSRCSFADEISKKELETKLAARGFLASTSQPKSTPLSPPRISKENRPACCRKPKSRPLLEEILRQETMNGVGISMTVATELSIILWLVMEIGNAWTAMALTLLATDREACKLVQGEIDTLEMRYGYDELFKPHVLLKMEYLNALLCESIRLCPSNLGGLKVTTETIEIKDAGVQIPKNSNIFFCQPTHDKFNIKAALGQKPETMGSRYPSVELHGFLPLQGMEVPLMVLQSKVFLITTLRQYAPAIRKRKTIIRRVKDRVNSSSHELIRTLKIPGSASRDTVSAPLSTEHSQDGSDQNWLNETPQRKSNHIMQSPSSVSSLARDIEMGSEIKPKELTQTRAMSLFTKTPFPEPKRVVLLQPRDSF